MRKNPFLFILFLIFVIVNIADMVSTHFILPGESNPIYILTKSLVPFYFLKLFAICFLGFYVYRNIFPSNVQYYIFVSILVLTNIMVGFAAASNSYYAIYHPEYVEAAASVPNNVKVQNYGFVVGILFIIPILLSLVCFYIYDKSYKYTVINKEYYKQKKWWQL
jgi:hypothetical protein